jgi:superfamily I DNA/RNA helicase
VPDIVLRADQFIAQNRSRYAKHMTAEREAIPGLAVQQVSFPDSSQQYDWLLEQARHPAEQTAVLYRNHDSVLPLLDLLEREGLPYGLRESNVLFFSHFAVRDILDILQFAHHPDNPELFRKIYYKIGRNIRKVDMDRVLKGYSGGHLVKAVRDLPGMEEWRIHKLDDCISALGQLKKLPMPQALRCILQDLSYQEYYYHRTDDDNRLRILRALANQNREPAAFLKRLDRLKDLVKTGSQDLHFLLSTMHASKGLEFDRVILLDVRDGILPTVEEPAHGGQLDAEDRALLEEERRLFYVAVTRAKNKLEILRCERESGVAVRGSRFAKQLLEDENKTRKSFRRKRIELGEDKRLGTLWDYQPGDVVWHVRFGTGSVVSRNGDEVTIVFSSKWGEKSLMLPACLEGCLLYLVETEK